VKIRTAIVTVPRIEPHRPPAGAAIIGAVCEKQGHDVTAYDLNIDFFNHCAYHNQDFYAYDRIWDEISNATPDQQKFIDKFIRNKVKLIAEQNYNYILVSIFGQSGVLFSRQFLTELREKTSAKIVVGGMAVAGESLVSSKTFGDELLEKELIDTYIAGEGEISLEEYLKGNTEYPGINNTKSIQVEDLDTLTWPNYKYFDLDAYDYLEDKRDVFITGSRGCVRRCGYCDIERYWPKFRFRSGKNIANEIIKHYEEQGITNFYFTDSLINGSRSAFEDMCNTLASYKFETPISWKGQFIFRRKHQLTDDHFDMIKQAGGNEFYVGFETGSDRLRFEMGKKYTNEDIDYQLEQFSRVKLHVMPLMFTGYVTETLQDHIDTKNIFKRWQKYVADGTIIGIELGANLVILPGSPVERMIESHGIEFAFDTNDDAIKNVWHSSANPDLTIREKVRRKLELHEEAIKYNWPVWRQKARLEDLRAHIIKNNLHLKKPEFRKLPVKMI